MLSEILTFIKMNIESIKTKLISFGFSQKESEVYLTLLQIGSSSVLEISRSCSVKRATIYAILESLEKKWLVELDLTQDKHRYRAEHPNYIEQMIENQKKELSSLLPELESIYSWEASSNAIKFYRGKQAMYKAYADLLNYLKPSDDYLVFWDLQSWYETDPDFFQSWPEKRKKQNRWGRSIFTDSPMAQEYQKKQWEYETQVKVLKSQKDFHAIKLVTSHHIFLHKTWKPYLVIMIEDPNMVKLYKEMFEVLWEAL